MRYASWLWLASALLGAIGIALVFGAVTMDGLFVPGVLLIIVGVIAAAGAGILHVVRAR